MDQQIERERTLAWSDPSILARKAQQMTGLQFLQAVATGELPPPPVSAATRIRLDQAEEGRAVFLLEPDESLYNPIGSVHGGIIATICDSAASCAIHSLLPAGQAYTTLEMKVNYLRPIMDQTGLLRCIGEVIHAGRRIGIAEARLQDAAGKLYAHATVTCLIFQPANGQT